jgi:SAM-dependent methyltransferase
MRSEKRARAARWISGSGIEIGALHNPLPVPEGVEVRYVDRATEAELRRMYPELNGEDLVATTIVGDAENLSAIADDSVDFVIANHLLEHLENPIRGLQEMTRVVRPGGILYIALPDPRVTFDRNRPLTSIDHLVREYREGTVATREDHFVEWVEKVEPLTGGPVEGTVATGAARVRQLLDLDYSIHFHVWRAETFLEFLVTAMQVAGLDLEPLEFMACSSVADDEYILVLRKGSGATPPETPPLPSDVEVNALRSTLDRLSSDRGQLADDHARVDLAAAQEREARLRAESALAALTASRSWRLTAPLRAAARAARSVRRTAQR